MSDSLRRTVHKGTTKVQRNHKFVNTWRLAAGAYQSNDPADQQKAIVHNELVANAVALQNVVDQTQALHALKSEGYQRQPRRSGVPESSTQGANSSALGTIRPT